VFAELLKAITGSPQFTKFCFATIQNNGDYQSIKANICLKKR